MLGNLFKHDLLPRRKRPTVYEIKKSIKYNLLNLSYFYISAVKYYSKAPGSFVFLIFFRINIYVWRVQKMKNCLNSHYVTLEIVLCARCYDTVSLIQLQGLSRRSECSPQRARQRMKTRHCRKILISVQRRCGWATNLRFMAYGLSTEVCKWGVRQTWPWMVLNNV